MKVHNSSVSNMTSQIRRNMFVLITQELGGQKTDTKNKRRAWTDTPMSLAGSTSLSQTLQLLLVIMVSFLPSPGPAHGCIFHIIPLAENERSHTK